MLKDPSPKQSELEMVMIEDLVPQDHLLRLIDKHIDFEFIREETRHLYCEDNGRPALDPVRLFKMLFIGYLFGIRSERQLVKEIEVNIAYRWFLEMGLTEKVPNASTFSQNRIRRFSGTAIEQVIFDRIVQQAIDKELISGRVLYTDSTHLKANANKRQHDTVDVEQVPMDYLKDLALAVEEDRQAHGKKPLKEKEESVTSKPTKVSRTDPEAGYMYRDHKPEGFFYFDHRSVDSKYNLITDTFVTAGNVHDSRPYIERLDRQRHFFQFEVEAVGLDAGYNVAAVCHGLVMRGIEGVVGYRRPQTKKDFFYKKAYDYDPGQDHYVCPQGEILTYSTTNRDGYREYKSDPKVCAQCPVRANCTQSENMTKVVTRHVWEDDRAKINSNRLTSWGKRLYRRRGETVERSFADAKQLHGHRYARFRGLSAVQGQCLLAAACQNMKKMAHILERKARKDILAFFRVEYWCVSAIWRASRA